MVVPPMPPIKQWKTETQVMLRSELWFYVKFLITCFVLKLKRENMDWNWNNYFHHTINKNEDFWFLIVIDW